MIALSPREYQLRQLAARDWHLAQVNELSQAAMRLAHEVKKHGEEADRLHREALGVRLP